MLKRLQITLTATLTAISFLSALFSAMPARAESGAQSGGRTGAITSTSEEVGRFYAFPIPAGLLECDRTPFQAGSDERGGDAGGTLSGFGSEHLPRRQSAVSPDT